jgi:DNA-binding winged helix-turn-helix (wHTH) protein
MVYHFDDIVFDPRTGELWKTARCTRLRPQPCAALVYLLDHAGRLVTREELRLALWSPGTFVEFDGGLNSCIKQVRAALGETRAQPRYIETFTRRGYRFIASVRRVDGPTSVTLAGSGHWATSH